MRMGAVDGSPLPRSQPRTPLASHHPPSRGGKFGEDFDVLQAQSELQLTNWFYEHVRTKVAVTNDLPFDVEVRWENTATSTGPQPLIEIPRGKTADIDTFESHHLRFLKREVRTDLVVRLLFAVQRAYMWGGVSNNKC